MPAASKSRPARRASASRPATKADLDALRAELLAAIEHAAWLASLPSEPIDDETRAELEAARADPTPPITHAALKRELGL